MRRPLTELLAAAALAFALAGGAQAQTAPPAAAPAGIQGQNIFDVKPEVKRDAASDPGYMDQTNGQRNAVQPGNNAPLWRGVQGGNAGYSSLPKSEAPEAGVLIQAPLRYPGTRFVTAGEAWREVRNQWIIPYGGSLLLIVLVALAIFYFGRGPIGAPAQPGAQRRIERFTPFERAAHWVNAIAFVVLGLSGIVMAFGKFFLLPLIGQTLFGYLTYLLKNLHNFAGPLFAVSLLVIFLTFLRDNLPRKGDLQWLLRLGGLFGKTEVPSHRFNAGEKMIFWGGVLVLGAVVVGSGLVLDKLIPNLVYERQTMQLAHMVHAVATVLMLAAFFGHIYMGTVGMRGAYDAMRTGYVDDAWAHEHHADWHDDIKAGRIPAERSKPAGAQPAPGKARPA